MYFVDQNNEIITKAKYEFSTVQKDKVWQSNMKRAKVCQEQKYFATYWKWSKNILIWKNKKKIRRILINNSIDIVILRASLMAVLVEVNINIYFQNKLITKSQNIRAQRQITFNNSNQIIFKSSETVGIYDFIRKSLTICDQSYFCNKYEYCPINDFILIPSGDKYSCFMTIWNIAQKKIINEIFIGNYYKELSIKMSKSGRYFSVSEYFKEYIDIYSYDKTVTHLKRILNQQRCFRVEWILGDKYLLLIHQHFNFKIVNVESEESSNCKIQKSEHQGNVQSDKYYQLMQQSKQKILILLQMSGNFIHYFSIIL